MTRKLFSVLVCAAMLFASLACSIFSGPNFPQAPGSNSTPTESVATTTPEPTATEDTLATAAAATESAQATEEAQVLAVTQEAAVKETDQANQRMLRTATAEGKATVQANDMFQQVEKLQQEGVLTSTAGQYYTIEDFKENWAQLGWYQWWKTGYKPVDFVVRAHTAWESASRIANWYESGCGFVFREKDENNHYMIFLALDGNVYWSGYVEGKYRTFGKGYAGKIQAVKGEADIILVAQGDHVVYYVNGQKVLDKTNSELTEGDLALTLNSGTNKDFGTRCEITNIELWELAGQ